VGGYSVESTTRILLVEDLKAYRSLVVALLSSHPDLDVVCEVEDGLAAVVQAQRLRPDLVLMDIGLPELNGLEAARQICDLVPTAKIVFLTVETDVDVVKEAFRLGACGYVLKHKVETDVLAALAAVLQGRRFVGSGLSGAELALTI
jgi:DNA-binding NarL/FixJ family response regulator